MRELSKKEAILLHREMWNSIALKEQAPILKSQRKMLEEIFITNKGYTDVLDSCFLCEYARQQLNEKYVSKSNYCKYCPVDWGNSKSRFMCENSPSGDWRWSDPNWIANLPEKEDNLNE